MGADGRQSFVSQYYTGQLLRGNARILCSLLQATGQGTHPTGSLFGAATSLTAQEQRVSDYDPDTFLFRIRSSTWSKAWK